MNKKRMWLCVIILVLCSIFTVRAEVAEGNDSKEVYTEGIHLEAEDTEGELESLYTQWQEKFMGELEFDEIQQMLDEELGKDSFSIWETLKSVMKGELPFSKETVQELLYSLFFSQLNEERGLILKIILLVLFAAIFHVFTDVFEDGQIGTISFYIVYLLMFIFLADNFAEMSRELEAKLSWFSEFMKGLTPAYYMTVAASSGVTTAAVFYQGILLLLMVIQWGLKSVVLPCANLYILLMFVNHLSKEEMVNKLADLLYSLIGWILKTFMGVVVGLQVVQGLVTPVVDSLKRGLLGKTASMIPGIGSAVNTVTELMLTGAVLIRNSLGVVVLLILVIVGAKPMIHYVFMSLVYRLLAAIAEPVSDKRIVACLSTMGEGCMLLFRIVFHAEFLCVVTFLILMMSFGGRV